MMKHHCILFLICGLSAAGFQRGSAQPLPRSYPDGHGGSVLFPMGDVSFADEVISFRKGDPETPDPLAKLPGNVLGTPDYRDASSKYSCSLGCGGEIVLRFKDNALTDVPGPDLYVFEIGENVEPTSLAISKDGISWLEVGRISGGQAAIDIQAFVMPGDIYYYVKLTDLESECASRWPGADIDAVGAIGSILQLSLEGNLLFETGSAELKTGALQELEVLVPVISRKGGYSIVVEGHTDNKGNDEDNLRLSLERAMAVKKYLVTMLKADEKSITVKGYGEMRPLSDNATEEGRQRNRRVSLLLKEESVYR